MGVPFRIVLYADSEATANEVFAAAFRRIAELNSRLSDYDPDSELMQLCRSSGPGQPVSVSHDLFQVLRQAEQISRQSGGAFDVTVGPVVRLWRRARRQNELPDAEQLALARTRVDYRLVRLDAEHRTVELGKDEMRLDLGGIAKGYAVDEALKILRERGITSALVDGGGDLVVSDAPPGQSGWRLGIAALRTPEDEPAEYLMLKNAAIATSGDAYQFIEIDGVRYSHLVDPRTGLGLTTRSSVTVIAPDGLRADAWASALSVLPPCTGLQAIDPLPGVSALIVLIEQGEPREYRSCGFPRTHRPERPAEEAGR